MGNAAPVERLGDRYALYGEIAAGGMATVHFGRLLGPVGFSRTVAIKRLHAQLARQAEFVSMFLDEARLAARVRHPNVVATIDVVETTEQICLVMEYVQGESLWRLIRAAVDSGGRVPRRIVASIVCGVLHGLHAAHEAKNERGEPLGIVHRDISPQNILVGVDGVPRVIDFGIAKAVGRLHTTGEGKVKGKFAYMSPEQLLDGEITRLTDVYATSVLLWELLTGQRLFDAESQGATVQKVLAGEVKAPSAIVPSLVPALDEIVLKGISQEPSKRFQTAREMARAIEDCIAPASPTEVGEWVEKMAGDRLKRREARLKEIEDSSSSGMPEREDNNEVAKRVIAQALPTVPMLPVTPISGVSNVPELDASRGLSRKTPESGRVPAARVTMDDDVETLKAVAPSLPPLGGAPGAPDDNTLGDTLRAAPPAPRPGNRDLDFDPFGHDESGGPIELEQFAPPRRVGVTTVPASNRYERGRVEAPARKTRWGRLVFVLVFFAAIGGGFSVGYLRGPDYAKRRAVEAAARQGVDLSVDRVTFHWRAVLLDGVKAQLRDLPDVKAEIAEVEIGLSGLEPRDVTVRNFDLTVVGSLSEVLSHVAAWHAKYPEALRLHAQAGHVLWTAPVGAGTQIEAWDTSADLAAASRDDARVRAPGMVVRTAHGSFGPWDTTYERKDDSARLGISLNPAAPDSATVSLVNPAKGGASLTVAVPRSLMSRVGLPPETFGLAADAEMEARVVGTRAEGRVDGQGTLSFFAAKIAGAKGVSDVRIEGSVAGDPSGPMPLGNAQLIVAGVKTRLAGTLGLQDAAFRLELGGARPTGGATPKGTPPPPSAPILLVDSRDMGGGTSSPGPPPP